MSSQETVACPSCGETATYNVGDKDITLAQFFLNLQTRQVIRSQDLVMKARAFTDLRNQKHL